MCLSWQYTWTNDRLWRKNRRENDGSFCDGVDLKKNYNDHWAEVYGLLASSQVLLLIIIL